MAKRLALAPPRFTRARKADTLHRATTTGVMRYLLRHHGRPSAVADWESRQYRHPKQQGDERHEYEAEVIADGQELQVIELLGGEPDGAADWSIEQLPGEVA